MILIVAGILDPGQQAMLRLPDDTLVFQVLDVLHELQAGFGPLFDRDVHEQLAKHERRAARGAVAECKPGLVVQRYDEFNVLALALGFEVLAGQR